MLAENVMSSNRHDRAPDYSTVSIQNGGQSLPCGFNFAGRYIEMRMRRVHLRMRTEGIYKSVFKTDTAL